MGSPLPQILLVLLTVACARGAELGPVDDRPDVPDGAPPPPPSDGLSGPQGGAAVEGGSGGLDSGGSSTSGIGGAPSDDTTGGTGGVGGEGGSSSDCTGVVCADGCACVADGAAPLCQCLLSQTSSSVPDDYVACAAGLQQAENRYFRFFNLAALGIPSDFELSAARFTVFLAQSATGIQPIEVKLYEAGAPLLLSNLQPLSSATHLVANGSLSEQLANIGGTVSAGATLGIEVRVQPAAVTGNVLLLGVNESNESAPGYVVAPTCGLTQLTTFASAGAGMYRLILDVIGSYHP